MKKYYVLIGNYGSGKTELALNFAFKAAEQGLRTELLDLDMVNTYFRLTERGKMARMKEIRLVSPNYASSGIETLSLPAEVASAFDMDWDCVVFDVGGDAVGSTALGRYHQDFMELEPEQLELEIPVGRAQPGRGAAGNQLGGRFIHKQHGVSHFGKGVLNPAHGGRFAGAGSAGNNDFADLLFLRRHAEQFVHGDAQGVRQAVDNLQPGLCQPVFPL